MSIISYPVVDQKLYRYRPVFEKNADSLKYLLDEIKTGYIYLADPDSFNDPFETQYISSDLRAVKYGYKSLIRTVREITSNVSGLEDHIYDCIKDDIVGDKIYLRDFISKTLETAKDFCPRIRDEKDYYNRLVRNTKTPSAARIKGLRVASFSETYRSASMWAYYANSHRGVCLEYDFSRLDKDSDILARNMYKVSYSTTIPENKFGRIYSPTVKGVEWAHEREWRFIANENDAGLSIKDGKPFLYAPYLSGVYFGCKLDKKYQSKIMKEIISDCYNKRVNIYRVSPCADDYEFDRSLVFGTAEYV